MSTGLDAQPSIELIRVTGFLTEIGLPWRWLPGAKGFIDGVSVNAGGLDICPSVATSAVLHEAGHLSIMPGRFRQMAQGDLSMAVQTMFKTYIAEGFEADSPAIAASLQCSDTEATAWAWAAGLHLGLAPGLIIADHEYDGEGAILRLQLQMRRYLGINGLSAAGFCVTRAGQLERIRGLPAYPRLARWLQKDFDKSPDETREPTEPVSGIEVEIAPGSIATLSMPPTSAGAEGAFAGEEIPQLPKPRRRRSP